MPAVDVVVIGAGPAGSAAAVTLARRGRRVLVLEKGRFPRRKVCGEFLSGEAVQRLAALGLRSEIETQAEAIREGVLSVPGGREIAFRLPATAWSLSRENLDARLARHAETSGAELRFGARVRGVERARSGFRVRYSEGPRAVEIEARAVVGAWGRWDALDRDWNREGGGRGRRFLAWSRGYEPSEALAGRVGLYLFRGGYCGLSRIEGGAVHLAGIIEDAMRQRLPPGWDGVVAHARASNPALDRALERLTPLPSADFRGAGPVYLAAKPPVERGVLMVGDAAGVLDPFSGQGIASALSSGILAAQTLEAGFSRANAWKDVPGAYAAKWRAGFRERFGWSAAFRRLVQRPAVARTAARWAGSRIVASAIRRLSAGGDGPGFTS